MSNNILTSAEEADEYIRATANPATWARRSPDELAAAFPRRKPLDKEPSPEALRRAVEYRLRQGPTEEHSNPYSRAVHSYVVAKRDLGQRLEKREGQLIALQMIDVETGEVTYKSPAEARALSKEINAIKAQLAELDRRNSGRAMNRAFAEAQRENAEQGKRLRLQREAEKRAAELLEDEQVEELAQRIAAAKRPPKNGGYGRVSSVSADTRASW